MQMIAVMAKNGLVNKAFKLYQSMKKAGVKPGTGTFMWLLISCTRAPTNTGGAYIPRCYYVFDEMEKFHVSPSIQHFNFALQTCANVGDVSRAEDIVTIMQQHKIVPDVNSYTSLLKASGSSVSKVLFFWNQLKAEIAPDLRAYNTLLSTLKDSSNPMLCLRVYKELQDGGLVRRFALILSRLFNRFLPIQRPDKHTMSILFDVLIKEGQLKEAASTFDEFMRSPSVSIDTQLANKLISVASRFVLRRPYYWYSFQILSGGWRF
jgi:pentatricopeptide repeat protein